MSNSPNLTVRLVGDEDGVSLGEKGNHPSTISVGEALSCAVEIVNETDEYREAMVAWDLFGRIAFVRASVPAEETAISVAKLRAVEPSFRARIMADYHFRAEAAETLSPSDADRVLDALAPRTDDRLDSLAEIVGFNPKSPIRLFE